MQTEFPLCHNPIYFNAFLIITNLVWEIDVLKFNRLSYVSCFLYDELSNIFAPLRQIQVLSVTVCHSLVLGVGGICQCKVPIMATGQQQGLFLLST